MQRMNSRSCERSGNAGASVGLLLEDFNSGKESFIKETEKPRNKA